MFDVSYLSNYSPDVLVGLVLAIAIGGTLIGHITDVVMGERGFGPFGNGVLAVFGAGLGIYVRAFYFGVPKGEDLMVSACVAASAATGILLLLGVAKSLIQD